jgi:hypothetical protein
MPHLCRGSSIRSVLFTSPAFLAGSSVPAPSLTSPYSPGTPGGVKY